MSNPFFTIVAKGVEGHSNSKRVPRHDWQW